MILFPEVVVELSDVVHTNQNKSVRNTYLAVDILEGEEGQKACETVILSLFDVISV